MSLPDEIECSIISFFPQKQYSLVCKKWNCELKNIYKKSVNKIGKWYLPYQRDIEDDFNTMNELIRHMVLFYPKKHFITYPEFCVETLNLNRGLIDVLPKQDKRKRSDVRDWLYNIPLTLDDMIYVGW